MSRVQQRNAEMEDLLAGTFQRRWEPNFAWVNAVALHLLLPQLRAFWPVSSVDENGNVRDLSAQGRTLTNTNAVPFAVQGLAPYANHTPASSHYFTRADEAGLDITAGLTMGAWFRPDTTPGALYGLMGKFNSAGAGNQRSYLLYQDATDHAVMAISADGTSNAGQYVTVQSSAAMTVGSGWYHIVGRFTPSSALDVFLNGTKTTLAAGIPAGIFNSTSAFEVGRETATDYYDGRWGLGFLCAAALDDVVIESIYWQTQALFGVQDS